MKEIIETIQWWVNEATAIDFLILAFILLLISIIGITLVAFTQ